MTWGSWGKSLSQAEMTYLINLCVENRIFSFDHADIYGGYTTEAEFGEALKKSTVSRSSVQLITKCGIQYVCENRPNRIKHYDYSKDYIIWSVENSLRKLKTDYLDLLLLHRPSPLMNPEEIGEAVYLLKKEGKILDFGVSNFSSAQTELIRNCAAVNFNQIQFSATDYDAMLDGNLDYMQLNKIQPMAWNPLGSVFKSRDEKSERVRQQAQNLAEKYSTDLDTILLAWIIKHPAGIIPVCGTTDRHRISRLILAEEIELQLEDWFSIWVASSGTKVP